MPICLETINVCLHFSVIQALGKYNGIIFIFCGGYSTICLRTINMAKWGIPEKNNWNVAQWCYTSQGKWPKIKFFLEFSLEFILYFSVCRHAIRSIILTKLPKWSKNCLQVQNFLAKVYFASTLCNITNTGLRWRLWASYYDKSQQVSHSIKIYYSLLNGLCRNAAFLLWPFFFLLFSVFIKTSASFFKN